MEGNFDINTMTKINSRVLLKSGEKWVLGKSGNEVVRNVDAESTGAWKNGLFIFVKSRLEVPC